MDVSTATSSTREAVASTTTTTSMNEQNFQIEGPSVMLQALQTFQADMMDNNNNNVTGSSASTSIDSKNQQQQQLPTMITTTTQNDAVATPPPTTTFPLINTVTNNTMSLAQQQQQQQQQMQWHQALQSLATVQQQQRQQQQPTAAAAANVVAATVAAAALGIPNMTAPAPAPAQQQQQQQQVDVVTQASVAAAAVPYLASLTIPHLMQFNQLQQQQQQQSALQQQFPIPIQPAYTTVQPQQGTNIKGAIKMKTASKRKYSSNGKTDSSSKTTGSGKAQKRSLKNSTTGSSTVISLSGGSNSTTDVTRSSTSLSSNHQQQLINTTDAQHINNGSNSRSSGGSSSNYVHFDHLTNYNSNNHIDGMDNIQPPQEKSAAAIEKMSASERLRYERNLREQQRSYRISQQIKELRDTLQQSNVPFRPNKYSILVSVAEYIQQLQSRAIMLDAEHERLIKTIRSTTEATSKNNTALENDKVIGKVSQGSSLTSSEDGNCDDFCTSDNNSTDTITPDSLFVPGIDYEAVFSHCPYPLGVATLDGRIIAANRELESLLNPNYETHNYTVTSSSTAAATSTRNTMIDQSFFVYIRNHQEIFEAMAALLKQSTASIERGEGTITKSPNLLFWNGKVVSSKNEVYPFTITVTNTENDNPKYFNLSAARGA